MHGVGSSCLRITAGHVNHVLSLTLQVPGAENSDHLQKSETPVDSSRKLHSRTGCTLACGVVRGMFMRHNRPGQLAATSIRGFDRSFIAQEATEMSLEQACSAVKLLYSISGGAEFECWPVYRLSLTEPLSAMSLSYQPHKRTLPSIRPLTFPFRSLPAKKNSVA